jgi:hypothetical protein
MRGHVRKCHTWEFIVGIGPHPVTGRRRPKSKSGFATKRSGSGRPREAITCFRRASGGSEELRAPVLRPRFLGQVVKLGVAARARQPDSRSASTCANVQPRLDVIPHFGGVGVFDSSCP